MALTLRIERKYFFAGLIVLGLVLGGVRILAQTWNENPNPGHPYSQLQECGAEGEVLKMNSGGSWACGTDNGGGDVWTKSDDNKIYYKGSGGEGTGQVSIGTSISNGNLLVYSGNTLPVETVVNIINTRDADNEHGLYVQIKRENLDTNILDLTSGITSKFSVRGDGSVCMFNSCKTSWPTGWDHSASQNIKLNGYRVSNDGGSNDGFIIGNDGPVIAEQLTANKLYTNRFTGGGVDEICLDNAGRIVICGSSARYKKDIKDLLFGLETIEKLRPVTFNWKESGDKDFGLIAEEVEKVNPIFVTYNNDKGQVEGVKYDKLVAVLINAIKEQQSQIEEQKEQIKRQDQYIRSQQWKINELEDRMKKIEEKLK